MPDNRLIKVNTLYRQNITITPDGEESVRNEWAVTTFSDEGSPGYESDRLPIEVSSQHCCQCYVALQVS